MKDILHRLFFKRRPVPKTCSCGDKAVHEGLKTKPGQGPFLLSFDGRVIPLRNADFLKRH